MGNHRVGIIVIIFRLKIQTKGLPDVVNLSSAVSFYAPLAPESNNSRELLQVLHVLSSVREKQNGCVGQVYLCIDVGGDSIRKDQPSGPTPTQPSNRRCSTWNLEAAGDFIPRGECPDLSFR